VTRHRGVTLIEMLVTVAILVIIMTVLVQVFQAATGALSTAQALQQIDDQLRRASGLIRADLSGVTARFTPPLDPAQNQGYFEYGENEFADVQGEDSDDYIRFTAKAPEGRPFTGRMWVSGGGNLINLSAQPVTVTSDYAEIIYFLRNGNLYRRVLLVLPPELQSAITQSIANQYYSQGTLLNFTPQPVFQGNISVSWQGMNDVSARPRGTGAAYNMANPPSATGPNTIVLNTLGDLTNRENRFAAPRFADDFVTISVAGSPPTVVVPAAIGPDGISDDQNSDNVPDYYPTIYPGSLAPIDQNGNTSQLIFEPFYGSVPRPALGLMGFPFIFPGAYSVPQNVSTPAFGWIHAPSPEAIVSSDSQTCTMTRF
jgi:prepilin-type N-terminal cleavage/methylation domain-containing protein